jgi:hypothetical protein
MCEPEPEPEPIFMLFIVFHKHLVLDCYKELSDEDLEKHIRFVAVNAQIPKEIPARLAPFVIHERDFPFYDPFLQFNNFCESSVFFHIWRNRHLFLDKYPYIGFLHYDMEIKKLALDIIGEGIRAAGLDKPLLFTHKCLEARPHINQAIQLMEWEQVFQIYRLMFQSSKGIFDVLDEELPFYHSFVLHRDQFSRMMTFAQHAASYLFERVGFQPVYMPFMLERMHALFLGLDRADGRVTNWIDLSGSVLHHDSLKDLAWKDAARQTGI